MKNKVFVISFLLLLFFIGVFWHIGDAIAQHGLKETAEAAGLVKYGDSVPKLIGNVIGTALSLISVIFFALMIFGGFLWMTAHGNEEYEKKALKTIQAAIIGIIIVLASYAITSFVFKSVGDSGGGGGGGATDNSQCTAKGAGFDCRAKSSCVTDSIETGLCPGGADNVCCKLDPDKKDEGKCIPTDLGTLDDLCEAVLENTGACSGTDYCTQVTTGAEPVCDGASGKNIKDFCAELTVPDVCGDTQGFCVWGKS